MLFRPCLLCEGGDPAFSKTKVDREPWPETRAPCGSGSIFPKYVPDCLFPKCVIGHGVSGKVDRLKTGLTEPAAGAAGPGSGAAKWSHQRGQRCAVGWLHAAPAATKGCHFYLAENVSFLTGGNNDPRGSGSPQGSS